MYVSKSTSTSTSTPHPLHIYDIRSTHQFADLVLVSRVKHALQVLLRRKLSARHVHEDRVRLEHLIDVCLTMCEGRVEGQGQGEGIRGDEEVWTSEESGERETDIGGRGQGRRVVHRPHEMTHRTLHVEHQTSLDEEHRYSTEHRFPMPPNHIIREQHRIVAIQGYVTSPPHHTSPAPYIAPPSPPWCTLH